MSTLLTANMTELYELVVASVHGLRPPGGM
jgi:hypothetical protein